jgi:hypothetical protein
MYLFRAIVFKRVCLSIGALAFAVTASAQTSFSVGNKEVQVHGSIQQGFVVSDDNNFLTMSTTSGTTAMTDGALNVASQVTKKLRVGGQLYARNIGDLGNGRPQIDWLFADYRFHEAFGVRGGKVKTALGLFNDTQDMEFLHTWALLPQSVYPLDLRSVTIAHVGADVYGQLRLAKAGTVAYTVYGGTMPDDKRGGYRYGVEDTGLLYREPARQHGFGADVRWTAPVDGLTAGYSLMYGKVSAEMTMAPNPFVPFAVDFRLELPVWRHSAVFADYQRDRFRASAEWRHEYIQVESTPVLFPPLEQNGQAWFGSASYRVLRQLEVGAYRSQFVANTALPSSGDDNHIYDTAATARFDLTSFWNVKAEAHFMDGYGNPYSARGFYIRNNRDGFDPSTRMLVVRTGISF